MPQLDLTALLDAADAGLNMVADSMLKADLLLLEESQLVLKKVVEDVTLVQRTVATQGGPNRQGTSDRLHRLRSNLGRLKNLTQAADNAIRLRLQSAGISEYGYTSNGIADLRSYAPTIRLES